MRLYKLDDVVLNIQGNTTAFLNGITSNALDAPLNAFLNQHGRIIATFHQKRISDGEFLISVPVIAVEALLKHLERYAKLSHTAITNLTWTTPGVVQVSTFIDLDTGNSVFSNSHAGNVTAQDFTLYRLEKSIPLLGVDYQPNEFILNVDEYKYVSYTKGCFLGQEPVAKVHNRSKPTRKLTVQFEYQCSPQEAQKMTSKATDHHSGRIKGFVFINNRPA